MAIKSFHTSCQEDVYREVRSMLDELSDEYFDDAEHCDFYLKYGTTVVEISIEPYEDDNAVVEVLAYCVQGVEPTPELMRELLRINAEVPMGAFSMVGTDIFFSHSFLGRTLQPPQLLASLNNVASTSDTYDEQIVARFGGETALERLRDWSRRTLRAEAT
ncbi:MAG TPA: YbjN domain-containing protein [Thermoanaerobaculia bacterium]|nr:YbjN domain-containing protein [Thermoanaerobaculia bacterium]